MRRSEARMNSCISQLRCVSADRFADQQQRLVDLPVQRLQKLLDLLAGDGAFIETEVEIVERQPSRSRQHLPAEVVLLHGRVNAESPGAAAMRPLAYARLVDEDDRAPLFLGFFLAAGKVRRRHWRMLSSLRSRARPTGRCGLQPSRTRIFQTCPGW